MTSGRAAFDGDEFGRALDLPNDLTTNYSDDTDELEPLGNEGPIRFLVVRSVRFV